MSVPDEIPAFSIWETFNETIPALMAMKSSEKSAEHLAKIIKSGDFTNIFVYSRDPLSSFEDYQRVAGKYKSFTTWFLGRFFYLLSCETLCKSHNVYVDIQLCVLEQLSNTQLSVYDELAKNYCQTLSNLSDFVKFGESTLTVNVFIPEKYADLGEKLNLEPISIEITLRNFQDFFLNLLKIITFILAQSFDFERFTSATYRNLDDLLLLLSECSITVKLEIVKTYLQLAKKFDKNNNLIQFKMDLFGRYFEQLIYEIYNRKIATSSREFESFEALVFEFFEQNSERGIFEKLSEFLLTKTGEIVPSEPLLKFCKQKRRKPLFRESNYESFVKLALKDFNTSVFCGFRTFLLSDIRNIREEGSKIKCADSKIWNFFHGQFLQQIDATDCGHECKIPQFLEFLTHLATLLTEITIEMQTKLEFFEEEKTLFVKILALLNRHFVTCDKNVSFSSIFDCFLSLVFVTCPSNSVFFFDVFSFIFTQNQLSCAHFQGTSDFPHYKKELTEFCKFLTCNTTKQVAFKYLNEFLARISNKITQMFEIESSFMQISRQVNTVGVLRNLGNILTVFQNPDRVISEILIPAISSNDEEILREVTEALPDIICISSSGFVKTTRIEDCRLKISIFCEKCHPQKTSECHFARIQIDLTSLQSAILKNILKFLNFDNRELKLKALEVLPFCSNHILKFHSGNVAKIWVEKMGDSDETIRKMFAQVVPKIVKSNQENPVLSDTIKDETIEILCNCLLRLAKKSIQTSDFKLQETLLFTIEKICEVKCEKTVLPTIRILVYFIMIPTSKYSLIAVNKFFMLAEIHNTTPSQLYKKYKRDMCEIITHLCIVNQTLINYPLATSLCKISVTLEFYSLKDFITRECQHLLPFFVSKVIKSPVVGKLIEQMALLVNVGLPELLASIYGNIFLHIFLNETKDDFKQSTLYLEKITGLPSATLRKRNLWVILNELLLNFHEKREKVLLALRFLANEDAETRTDDVREYLQARLLGLLQHFDFKLMAKNTNRKEAILLSLADFLTFMGPSHVTPLRFKVIAMLRTPDCGDFPDLNCDVWEAFIRSCEVGTLATQLATIFVSLLPLIDSNPRKINDIFKFLVVENEMQAKDSIKDLFFVDDPKVDALVLQTIRKYVRKFDDCDLKEKMRIFLKYLTHETVEVRVRSLKQLKGLMEKNREELDQMILGYNGIDPIIVELIEVLTLGCREKDPMLKLACGEVIGELGAVEPSHLPRKYAQNSRFFTFFMDDDGFITNALNELTRALQGEKNTVNLDRFAVAIQEILKNYEISSDASSARNDLWKQFPESQQELMLPLLTSRYIVSQMQEIDFPSPIYGSVEGSSSQTWLYNWTRSLIMTLPQANQTVLIPCLPAMKQDTRILMVFLPQILLHSIICDSEQNREKAYTEIKAVIGTRKNDQILLRSLPYFGPILEITETEKAKKTQCTKIVFVILDFLDRWTREWQWSHGSTARNDPNFIKIKSFLGKFCKLELALCNFYCGEYPRALMYLEDYVTENPGAISRQLTFLAEIFAQLDEPDGVAGVTALQPTEPPIEQRILSLEVSGKLSDAAACYEHVPQMKLHHLKGLIRCYLDLDNVHTALHVAQGALNRQPEFGNTLFELQAEPLWRLGQYDDLSTLLNREEMTENPSWGVKIGRALLAFQNRDRDAFEGIIEGMKSQQVEFLGAASVEEGAYQHGYCYISRLHALNELQQVEKITYKILANRNDGDFVRHVIENLSKEWELRIKVVQESVRIIEPLLCLRRVAIEQSKRLIDTHGVAIPMLNSLLGECWLLSAQMARSAGVHQQGFTYTLKAEEYNPPSLFVEKSKLHWGREEHEQALTTLRRGLEILLPDNSKEAIAALSIEKRKICAEAKLLIACYNDSVSNVDTDIKTANYRDASEMYKEWETGLVKLAQFYDRRFQNYAPEECDSSKGSEMQIWMINCFCKSLRYGTAFVYQSMPRLLSIWFDYGTRLLDISDAKTRDERKNNLVKMTKLIDYALENLPTYVFLTAFSQIISRICHPQKEVYVELKSIIIKLLLNYPQQSLWMIISVIKSSYKVRAKRCVEIFSDAKLKTATMQKLVVDFTNLAEKLIELCNKNVAQDVETTTVSALLRALPRMLAKPDFSEIMIPTHKFRKLVLPNPDFSSTQHNPFPNHYVHIVGIEEEVTLLRSLQRPRKITFRGSDGRTYIQMLKPKDDLRKDFRLMEFNDIVNQLLSREPESRQRRLNIRLYSVAPLNEECGLIEWVPNLVGLRPILHSLYKQRGGAMTTKELRDASCNLRDPLTKKRDVFTKTLLVRHPPVLGEWFRKAFPDPQSWFFARSAYIRTTGVMSMVGYILGLGDRHGENILLDSTCGDTVHVDFNCLFNKGESFEWPERVPFRLTQNMVAAMGPLGVEGVFRKSCACTLRVLRTNANTLMSIVTPFVYDPLVSWPHTGGHNTAEKTNEQALDHVKNIQLRLQGIIVKTKDRSLSIPLSVDGQTNSLINEAMSIDNLCQMYIGWGPYL
ncbi:serine/threonine-protein kinase ATR-like [Tribolium madens]|uniref:serine/threonine-protein kinase ATR-like n=1 Tax=Tribolium madens TaxID=41895 RepID=UPI001CF71E21|nr:serine/threonine-protein kinase ATR-like [Tribolium madens]XP_044272748.1 serine/threonine-protein kinase ATR-like [Tribolium madens]